MEKHLVKAFPDVGIFIEKPVSTGPVAEAFNVAKELNAAKNVVSVGYMLRYLKVVQKMKRILEENNLKVMVSISSKECGMKGLGELVLTSPSAIIHLFPASPPLRPQTPVTSWPTSTLPSSTGGTSPSLADPSSSRPPTSVTCLVTSEAR